MRLRRITCCARCGEDHDDVLVAPLSRPMVDCEGFVVWSHWAACPTNGEPILVKQYESGSGLVFVSHRLS